MRVNHQVGDYVVTDERQYRFGTIAARRAVAEGDVLVEQEDFNVLGAVDEQLDVDLGIATRRLLEDRATQIRIKALHRFHYPRGRA